jgi:hypothetical protein
MAGARFVLNLAITTTAAQTRTIPSSRVLAAEPIYRFGLTTEKRPEICLSICRCLS